MEIPKIEKVKRYHKVKSGENLTMIAKKYGTTVSSIMAMNGLRSSSLSVGQNLLVKKGANVSGTTNSASTQKAISGRSGKTHVVRSGESLYIIAKKYNCDISDIKKWNNLKSTKLGVGQKLKIY